MPEARGVVSLDGKHFVGDGAVVVVVEDVEDGVGILVEEGDESVEGGSGELLDGELDPSKVAVVTCVVTVVRVAVAVIVDTEATTAGAVGKMLREVKMGVVDTPSVVDLCLVVAELTTRYTVENLPLPRTPSGALR